MWDLVGNPEDRFSHNEAQSLQLFVCLKKFFGFSSFNILFFHKNADNIDLTDGQY